MITIEMESSMNETDAQQSFRSPPRRRRSTFFERRDSIVPQIQLENEATFKKNEQDLERYYEQLQYEKEQWKTEVNNRRNKYHDLRHQYQMATKAPTKSRMSYSALLNEDIEYLKSKPNIAKLIESQTKLHKSVKETMALYRRVDELDNVVLNHCEGKVNKITGHILENSTIELVD